MGSKALASVACAAAVAMLCLQVVQLYASVHHLLNSKVHSPSLKPHRHYSYNGHDHPRTIPVPQSDALITVEDSMRFALEGPDAEADWASNTPRSVGFVRLASHKRIMVASMFHQLHCLRMFRWTMEDPSAEVYHAQHCLNYMRQMALCGADATLEPQDRDGEQTLASFSGNGGTHTCRDWSQVYPWIDANFDDWNVWWAAHRNDSWTDVM